LITDKSKGKGKEQEEEVRVVKQRTERTVDEIIASLKAGSGAYELFSSALFVLK